MATLSLKAVGILAVYVVLNIAYSFYLKHIAIVDVVIIAIGFVLRLFVGTAVTSLNTSMWIILMTFLLALFLALAKRRDDVLLFNKTGKEVIPSKYHLVDYEWEDELIIVSKNESDENGNIIALKYGVLNTTGNILVPVNFDFIGILENEMISVYRGNLDKNRHRIGGKYGFFNKKGEEVIPLKFDFILCKWTDLIKVFIGKVNEFGRPIDGKFGFIDGTGEEVIPVKYNCIEYPERNLFEVCIKELDIDGNTISKKYGLVNIKDEVIIPVKYESIYIPYWEDKHISAELDGKKYHFKNNGERVD
jgi:hypothetical protein